MIDHHQHLDTAEPATVSVAVRVSGVTKSFQSGGGEHVALRGVDLDIHDGEFLTVLGPSGCGKTTLLRILAGFEAPSTGDVFLDGERITEVPPNKRPMAMVFQNYALFPHLSVFDNIAYGLKIAKVPKSEIRERVDVVLSIMDLVGLGSRLPTQLSGGQQQRVALARSVVVRPRVLLFDEPLSNLDARLRDQMRSELRRVQRQLGVTSVYVTHDQAEAMAMSDRIVVMNEGQIEQIGTPPDVYGTPRTLFVADFIGKANVIRADLVSSRAGRVCVSALGALVDLPAPAFEFERVSLVIRPENVSIARCERPNDVAPTADATRLAVPGWLRRVEYLGAATHLSLELVDGSLLTAVQTHTVDAGPASLPREGSGIVATVPLTALLPVAD